MANSNGDTGWRKWTNQILFTLLILISSGALGLYMSSVKTEIVHLREISMAANNQNYMLLTKQGEKLDKVCDEVKDHNFQLRIPFETRQKYLLKSRWITE